MFLDFIAVVVVTKKTNNGENWEEVLHKPLQ